MIPGSPMRPSSAFHRRGGFGSSGSMGSGSMGSGSTSSMRGSASYGRSRPSTSGGSRPGVFGVPTH